MKLIKMFGLAALAALMAMAFVGAASAMAEPTSLCKEDTGAGCPGGSVITHVHEATLTGAPAIVLSVVNIKCDVLFLGDALGEGLGAPLVIHGHFTYTNCSSGCTVKEVSTDSLLEVLRLGHELADVTEAMEFLTQCSGVHCIYNGTGLLGHALGPLLSTEPNGEVRIEKQILNKLTGTFCPKESELDILTTPLEAMYLTK